MFVVLFVWEDDDGDERIRTGTADTLPAAKKKAERMADEYKNPDGVVILDMAKGQVVATGLIPKQPKVTWK